MRWEKRGRVFEASGQRPWMATHAALPAVDPAEEPLRVYFSSRDAKNRSQIGRFTLGLEPPQAALDPGADPVLGLGSLGAFDDSGVTSSCLVDHGGAKYLYYTGWSLGVTVPFYLQVGLAISEDGGRTFSRVSSAPILDRCPVDPYLTASPWVLREEGAWRMWYVSGTGWSIESNRPRHRYHIRHARSEDGVRWSREGRVCIDYRSPEEHAFGRPCVLREGGRYRMWYCHRGDLYRLGYAESSDGLSWVRRDDEAGLRPSDQGWDSEMTAYPMVFDHRGQRFMLYNGNGYGKTGIGLATLAP